MNFLTQWQDKLKQAFKKRAVAEGTLPTKLTIEWVGLTMPANLPAPESAVGTSAEDSYFYKKVSTPLYQYDPFQKSQYVFWLGQDEPVRLRALLTRNDEPIKATDWSQVTWACRLNPEALSATTGEQVDFQPAFRGRHNIELTYQGYSHTILILVFSTAQLEIGKRGMILGGTETGEPGQADIWFERISPEMIRINCPGGICRVNEGDRYTGLPAIGKVPGDATFLMTECLINCAHHHGIYIIKRRIGSGFAKIHIQAETFEIVRITYEFSYNEDFILFFPTI